MTEVRSRLEVVRQRLHQACAQSGRSPTDVRLVAVSKRQPDASILAALDHGQIEFGENFVQELLRKQELFPQARFHLIGHVQTNKAKKAAGAYMVHTLDSRKVVSALAKGVPEGRRLPVLFEVNIGCEPQKAGVMPSELEPLIQYAQQEKVLEPLGLMCIPPREEGRRWFSALRELAEKMRRRTSLALPELSMGMSADFEEAVLEGATIVRVGTAIFGPRRS